MWRIAPGLCLDPRLVVETHLRASGPGGQNVNKVSTAIQIRLDLADWPDLPPAMRERLAKLAGRRLTGDGVLIISAQRHRSQEDNRRDAHARLLALLRAAAIAPKTRHQTRPTRASRERRLDSKRRQGQRKAERRLRDE